MTVEEKLPEKKSKIPYFFFAFFSVILVVNIYYIYLSKKTWSGLVTNDSYNKGIHYNQIFTDAAKQKELGWQVEISYKNLGSAKGELEISLQDKNGKKISNAEVTAYFKRPTQIGQDFSQKLELTEGKYRGQIHFPLRGQWDIAVSVVDGEYSFQEAKRYIVQ